MNSTEKKIPVVVDPACEEIDEPECPMCGGPGIKMGTLGKLHWYRCRNCGMDFNREAA